MPKFDSKILREPAQSWGGGEAMAGQTVLIPTNDAAKAMDISDEAVRLGLYKRKTPDEKEKLRAQLKARSQSAAKRQKDLQ